MPSSPRVIIVGAGVAGLATAFRLRQVGWEPIIIERTPARRDGGYVLALHGIGYDAAERMGVLPDLEKRHFDPFELRYVKADGRPTFSVPRSAMQAILGPKVLTLLRGDIEDVFYQAVRDTVEIRFATTIHSVSQDATSVHVGLSDGTTLDADLLIGADGLHSTVRQLVFGPEDRFRVDLNHVVAALMLDPLPPGIEPGTTTTLATIGRTVTVSCVDSGRAAMYFVYSVPSIDVELAKGPQQAIDDAFGDLHWVVPDARARLQGDASVYFDGLSQIAIDRWSRGRVVLLGDAAWSVTLFGGYGASLAIGGADELGTALEHQPDDVSAALTTWESQLRPVALHRHQLGRRNTSAHAPPNRLHLMARNLIMRNATKRPVQRFLQRQLEVGE